MAEVKNKINKRKLVNHYKGQDKNKDEIDGKKKVRYHKHHHEKALIWKVDKDGKFLTGQEIWDLYKDKDPILEQEVEIPMIRDSKTGKLRKKTIQERYGGTTRKREKTPDMRLKMNSTDKEFNEMTPEEIEIVLSKREHKK